MNQQERAEQSIKTLSTSALWYAWGQIDASLHREGFGTEHGQEFKRLYEQIARDYAEERRTNRPNVLDAWREFVRSHKRLGLDATLGVEDIDRMARYNREDNRKLPEVPEDFPVRPLKPGESGALEAHCFTCDRRWDDAVVTSMTPAPAGRCPFEHFH